MKRLQKFLFPLMDVRRLGCFWTVVRALCPSTESLLTHCFTSTAFTPFSLSPFAQVLGFWIRTIMHTWVQFNKAKKRLADSVDIGFPTNATPKGYNNSKATRTQREPVHWKCNTMTLYRTFYVIGDVDSVHHLQGSVSWPHSQYSSLGTSQIFNRILHTAYIDTVNDIQCDFGIITP